MATPAELLEDAKCFNCIPPGMQGPVRIYLLMQNAGLDMTPTELMEAAKCYTCIPPGMQAAVQTYLLENGGGGGGGGGGTQVYVDNYGGGAPTPTPTGAAVAVDSSNDTIWYYTGGTWTQIPVGGAGTTIQYSAASDPSGVPTGNARVWVRLDNGKIWIYNTSPAGWDPYLG